MGTPKPKSVHAGLTKNQRKLKDDTNDIFKEAGELLSSVMPLNSKKASLKKEEPTGDRKGTDTEPSGNRQGLDKGPIKVRYLSDTEPSGNREGTENRVGTEKEPTGDRQGTEKEPTQNRVGTEIDKKSPIKPDDPIWYITDNRAIVLGYMIHKKERIVSRKEIMDGTGIKETTIRKAFIALSKEQFITKPQNFKNRGCIYSLHAEICNRFLKHRWPQIIKKYGDPPHINNLTKKEPSENREGTNREPSDIQDRTEKEPTGNRASSYNSSSSFYNKATTCETETILSNHPELGYWRQKGLTAKQINQWMKTVGCGPENIVQFLCYCRFEMVDLSLEESKPIENVFNWFFRILEKTGGYPKPKGYKSHQEKQIEMERQIIEQHEREAKEAKDLYLQKIKAKQDKQFWDMMNDPESELYKRCFDSLNDFQKKRTTGKGFEMAMRSFFDKFMEES